LAKFFHPTQIAIVAVSVDADGNVKFDLVVRVVGLGFADVPGHAGAAEHDAREGVVESVCGTDNTHAFGTSDPDPVVSEQFLGLIDAVSELGRPLVDIVE
jgi:hypothetical protein